MEEAAVSPAPPTADPDAKYPAPATPRTHPSRRWDRDYLQVSAKACYAVKRCKPSLNRVRKSSTAGMPRSRRTTGVGSLQPEHLDAEGVRMPRASTESLIPTPSGGHSHLYPTPLSLPAEGLGEGGLQSPAGQSFSSPRSLVSLLAQEDTRASKGRLAMGAARPCSVCERERERAHDYVDREKQRRAGVVVLPRLVHEPGSQSARPAIPDVSPLALPGTQLPPLLLRSQPNGGAHTERGAAPRAPDDQFAQHLLQSLGDGPSTSASGGGGVTFGDRLSSGTESKLRKGGSFRKIKEGGVVPGEAPNPPAVNPLEDEGDPPSPPRGEGDAEGAGGEAEGGGDGDGDEEDLEEWPKPPPPRREPPVWVKMHDEPAGVQVARIGRQTIVVKKVPDSPTRSPSPPKGSEVGDRAGRLLRRLGRNPSWRAEEGAFLKLLRQAAGGGGDEAEEPPTPYLPQHSYCRRHLHLDQEALRAVEEDTAREQKLGRMAVRRIRRQTREERDRARKNQKIQNRIRELEAEGDLGGDPELVRSLLQYGDARAGGETESLMESKLREFSGVAIMRSAIQQSSTSHHLKSHEEEKGEEEGEGGGGGGAEGGGRGGGLADRRASLESPGRSLGRRGRGKGPGPGVGGGLGIIDEPPPLPGGGGGAPPRLQRGASGSQSVRRGTTGATIQSIRAARRDPLLGADMSMMPAPLPETVSWSLDVSSFGERRKVADSRGYLDGQGVLRDRFRSEWARLKSRKAFVELVASGGGGGGGGAGGAAGDSGEGGGGGESDAGGAVWEGMDGVEKAFYAHYLALSQAYQYYSAVGVIGDACFHMPLPRLVLLMDDVGVRLPEGALDRAYRAALAREEGEGGAGWPDPSAGLQRFEFMHCIAHVAVAHAREAERRAGPGAAALNLAGAVIALCGGLIAPGLPPEATADPNEFRKDRLYKERVDVLLKERHHQLRELYREWCGRKGGSQRLCMDTWVRCLQECLLVSNVTAVSAHETKLCFLWSQHVIVDELDAGKRKHALSFLEFLEGLARLADLVSMPPGWALLRSYQANEGDSWDLRQDGTKRGPWWDREIPTPIPGSDQPMPSVEDAPYFYLRQSFLDGAEEWRRASQGLLSPNTRPLEEKLRTVLDVLWKHHNNTTVPSLREVAGGGASGTKWHFGGKGN